MQHSRGFIRQMATKVVATATVRATNRKLLPTRAALVLVSYLDLLDLCSEFALDSSTLISDAIGGEQDKNPARGQERLRKERRIYCVLNQFNFDCFRFRLAWRLASDNGAAMGCRTLWTMPKAKTRWTRKWCRMEWGYILIGRRNCRCWERKWITSKRNWRLSLSSTIPTLRARAVVESRLACRLLVPDVSNLKLNWFYSLNL